MGTLNGNPQFETEKPAIQIAGFVL